MLNNLQLFTPNLMKHTIFVLMTLCCYLSFPWCYLTVALLVISINIQKHMYSSVRLNKKIKGRFSHIPTVEYLEGMDLRRIYTQAWWCNACQGSWFSFTISKYFHVCLNYGGITHRKPNKKQYVVSTVVSLSLMYITLTHVYLSVNGNIRITNIKTACFEPNDNVIHL